MVRISIKYFVWYLSFSYNCFQRRSHAPSQLLAATSPTSALAVVQKPLESSDINGDFKSIRPKKQRKAESDSDCEEDDEDSPAPKVPKNYPEFNDC